MSGPPPDDRSKLRDNYRGPGGWATAFQVENILRQRKANLPEGFNPIGRLPYSASYQWGGELGAAEKSSPASHRAYLFDMPPRGFWTGDAMTGGYELDQPKTPPPATPPAQGAPAPALEAEIVSARPPDSTSAAAPPEAMAGFDRELVEVVKANLVKRRDIGLISDAELRFVLMRTRAYGLDPLQDTVAVWRDRQGALVVAPNIHGLLGMAEATGEYDGLAGRTIYAWETRDGKTETGPDPPEKAPLISATVGVRRRGLSQPVYATAFFLEVAKDTGLYSSWHVQPRHMLEVRATSFALRYAFPRRLAGVMTREELEDNRAPVSPTPPRSEAPPTPPPEHRQEAELPPAQSARGAAGATASTGEPVPAAAPPVGGGTTPPSGGTAPPSERDIVREQIQFLLDRADPERAERARAEFRDAMQQVGKPGLPECTDEELRWVLRRIQDSLGV